MEKTKVFTLVFKTLFFLLIALFFSWGIWNGYFSMIFTESERFLLLLQQHLLLVVTSSLMAVAVAIPLGIFVTRPRFAKSEWFVLNTANLGQTIPVIAILAIVMTYLGIGFNTAVFALFVFSLLPILRNTVAGLNSVDPAMKDAAKGMGLTPMQTLWRIEMPNAMFTIMAGVRTAIVMNIGTAALASLVGGGGLGDLIFAGINLRDNAYLFSGAVPVTLLALTVDGLLRLSERIFIPKGLQEAAKSA
ncbi:ABC transporter permease [Texcoconibacillus texcoconensis]|nr:ABC transporter permease [Texcoconibacillus texcoconensis]